MPTIRSKRRKARVLATLAALMPPGARLRGGTLRWGDMILVKYANDPVQAARQLADDLHAQGRAYYEDTVRVWRTASWDRPDFTWRVELDSTERPPHAPLRDLIDASCDTPTGGVPLPQPRRG